MTVRCLLNQAARYPGQVSKFLTVMQPQSTRRRVNYRIGAPRGVNSPFYPFYATSFFDLFGGLPATHTVRTVPYRDPTTPLLDTYPSSLTLIPPLSLECLLLLMYHGSAPDLAPACSPQSRADSSLNDRFPRFAANALQPNDSLPKLAANAGSQLLDAIQPDSRLTHPTPARAERNQDAASIVDPSSRECFSQGAIPWPPVWVLVCMNASARCTNEVSH
ncbi:hypothetical protein EDB85DRAFT_1193016 [Lactarius pseudohatsudake]|nr:hypothetical protein EDB85DRAFT_1193016 [Lactarius pseudohatsudake]